MMTLNDDELSNISGGISDNSITIEEFNKWSVLGAVLIEKIQTTYEKYGAKAARALANKFMEQYEKKKQEGKELWVIEKKEINHLKY